MRLISGRDYWEKAGVAALLLLTAAILFAVVFAFASNYRASAEETRKENEQARDKYLSKNRANVLSNAVVESWRKQSVADVVFPPKTEMLAKYLELVMRVTQEPSAEKRVLAFNEYLGVKQLPKDMPLGLYQALQDENMTPVLRHIRLAKHTSRNGWETLDQKTVDSMSAAWLAGERPELAKVPPPPTPKPEVDEPCNVRTWIIAAAILYALCQLAMGLLFYAEKVYDSLTRKNTRLVTSANPLTWPIAILFAPVLILPWPFFGIYKLACSCGSGMSYLREHLGRWMDKRRQEKEAESRPTTKESVRNAIQAKRLELEQLEQQYAVLAPHPHRESPSGGAPLLEEDFRRMEREAEERA